VYLFISLVLPSANASKITDPHIKKNARFRKDSKIIDAAKARHSTKYMHNPNTIPCTTGFSNLHRGATICNAVAGIKLKNKEPYRTSAEPRRKGGRERREEGWE